MDPRKRFSDEAIAAGHRAMAAHDRAAAEARPDDATAEENASVEVDSLAKEKARRRAEGEAIARARNVEPIAPAAAFSDEAAALAAEWQRRRREGEAAAALLENRSHGAAAAPLAAASSSRPAQLAAPIREARAAAAAARERAAALTRPAPAAAPPAGETVVDFEGETPPDRR